MNSEAAALVFEFLSSRDAVPAEPLDLVIGFGHFDLRIARHCCTLLLAGHTKDLAFTGGIGAGTADLGGPEADVFLREAALLLEPAALRAVICENTSTNTGENIRFLEPILRRARPALFNAVCRPRIGLVATPVRMRRDLRTAQQLWPQFDYLCLPPASSVVFEESLYASKQQALVPSMLGELQRLRDYPDRGWCVREDFPPAVLAAAALLR